MTKLVRSCNILRPCGLLNSKNPTEGGRNLASCPCRNVTGSHEVYEIRLRVRVYTRNFSTTTWVKLLRRFPPDKCNSNTFRPQHRAGKAEGIPSPPTQDVVAPCLCCGPCGEGCFTLVFRVLHDRSWGSEAAAIPEP